MNISQLSLREILQYDEESGVFVWRKQTSRRVKAGDIAGWLDSHGYIRIRIHRKDYQASRLAWLYVTGEWPKCLMDHINGIRADNCFKNLREADYSLNAQNQRTMHTGNKTGYLGVQPHGKRFRASMRLGKKNIYLGIYSSREEAHQKYLAAKRKLHEGCTI